MKNILLLCITSVILCFVPVHLCAQIITLGSANNFALFTTVGAITNTGKSQVTGHVGSNVGGSTTFGNVNGNMHDQDTASALCASAVLTAYGQLNSAPFTFTKASPLGNGDTLIPGVYRLSGASTLAQTLYLNAQGNPAAVFIIQVQGALSVNTSAKVKLLNGALACNVYWKVEGEVTLNTLSSMKGTIIANGGPIHILYHDTLEGRAIAINGAIDINEAMVYTPIGCGSPILLGPTLPNIGSLMCYTLFSTIGPVSNTGVTNVKGDIGSNTAIPTGFDTLLVKGKIHGPDSSTAAAATDLTAAYNQMNAMVEDIKLLYPAQFGQNLVLTPHTYLMNGAVSLTDTLYLNARGQTNATFVIKCYGALSALAGSRVVLINGTQAKNVYWMVNGAVSILAGAVFNGTIICASGAMDITSGAVVNGRALTTTGMLTTASATINMPPGCGPDLILQPINDTVCLGDTARFIVNATGTGLTYKWRKGNTPLIDGARINGVSNDTLTIFPTLITDTAYNYNVIVTASNGEDTSVFVSLVINIPTNIVTEPINQTVCLTNTVKFSVKSTGTNLTYQWRKGNVDVVNDARISGAKSDTLTITGSLISDTSSNYNVVVSGACGQKTSIPAKLILDLPIVLTAQPINATVCAGNTVSFTIQATGSGLTYQWRKGTTLLANTVSVNGVFTSTLTINPASIADTSSSYNVVVSGTCGASVTSNSVALAVNSLPSISVQPASQISCVGSAVSISVTATGSGLTYKWRKGTTVLVNSGNISGATSATLTINPVLISDTATDYSVEVIGTCTPSVVSNMVSVSLDIPASIIGQPNNQTVCEGSSVSFNVTAIGTGLTYRWYKGNIPLINSASISGVTTSTLIINPAAFSDTASNYNVVVGGSCLVDVTSTMLSLALNTAPVITVQPTNQVACIGNDVTISVVVNGTGLNYQWRKGTALLANSGNISGVFTSTLIITAALLSDSASNYNVVITGACAPIITSGDVSVVVNALPIALPISNSPICTEDTIKLTTAFIAGATYNWDGPNGFTASTQNATITNATTFYNGVYNLVVTTNGCASLPASVTIEVKDCPLSDFFIPEGFSPNGDNYNDVFVIRGINKFPNNSINIYNRWGVKVYESTPYTSTWDGTTTLGVSIGGSALPVGTYFYTLDLGDGSKVIQGSIYLTR